MEVASLALSIAGIVLALVLYFADLRKMITALLEREAGVLTAQQASSLCELYLEFVRKELKDALHKFLSKTLQEAIKTKNTAVIEHFANSEVNDKIKSARQKLVEFRLAGGIGFRDFIDSVSPLDSGIIPEAKEDCRLLLIKAINNGETDLEKLSLQAFTIVEIASDKTGQKILREIEKIYSKRRK